jgi:hypothetical protein
MATKVKMLKLIHEMSEFAHSMPRRPQQNRSGINAINPALVNPLRNPVKRRKIIPDGWDHLNGDSYLALNKMLGLCQIRRRTTA